MGRSVVDIQYIRGIMDGLKMFVWNDVLRDMSSGMICILAHDLGEALVLARKELESYEFADLTRDPKVYDSPTVVKVWGGG